MSIPDVITNLPTDKSQPSGEELKVVEALFGDEPPSTPKLSLLRGAKEGLLLAALFVLVSLPFVDSMIGGMVSINNTYVFLAVKGLLLAFVFLVTRKIACGTST